MKHKISDITLLLSTILIQRGLSHDEARIVAEDYIDAELRGKPSHGLAAFGVVAKDAESRGQSILESERGVYALFDGRGDIGHLVVRKALDWAASSCRQHGVALVGIKNIRRIATPGTPAYLGAKSGLITIVIEYGGKPFLAPVGAAEAILSTNPIGIGIPNPAGPIVLDMATSERAFYFITLAATLGKSIPPNWGLDEKGNPTTDPNQVRSVQPFGGYKGYGLSFMIEILTGILLGVPVGLSGSLSNRGALLVQLDPTVFGVEPNEFDKNVSQLISEIKSAKRTHDVAEILIPGEAGNRLRKNILSSGELEIHESVYEQLIGLTKS